MLGEGGAGRVPESLEMRLVAGLLLYFLARALFLALEIAPGIPPDESTHLGRVLAYARVAWLPADGPETYALGALQHAPPLYYLLMGKLLALKPGAVEPLVFLRIANVLLGVTCAYCAYRCAGQISGNPLARLLALLLVTNTLMFTGLSASVNYDNLANLLGALAIAALLAFLKAGGVAGLVVGVVALLAGALTKVAFLPLAGLCLVMVAVGGRAHFADLPHRSRDWLRVQPLRGALATLVVLGLLVANRSLYGGNLLRFGAREPRADRVLGLENALENRIFARNWIFRQFQEGELDYAQARARAIEIEHVGDRQHTLWLLERERRRQVEPLPLLGPLGYTWAWGDLMLRRTLGYTGHLRAMKSDAELFPYVALLVLALGALAVRALRGDGSWLEGWAGGLGIAYALVLLCFVNYPAYQRFGDLDVGVQGRYLFPVMAPLWSLAACGLVHATFRRWRPVLLSAVALWFVWGDVPWLLVNAPAGWFSGA